ncbi:MAG: hypothetical protein AB7F40_07100 [Victivallaceae bacterium]|nr:hypothetical protein [Victivallaceae bacterium]
MKTYQKILLGAVCLLVLVGMALPFVPLGVGYYGFDFNNGLYVEGKRYLWMFDSHKVFPSELSGQLNRLRLPVYPPLIQIFDEYDLVPMKKNPYPAMPPGFRLEFMKITYPPDVVPKTTPHDVLEFRDAMLNKYGDKETIEKAIAQGESRGGYIPDAKFEH